MPDWIKKTLAIGWTLLLFILLSIPSTEIPETGIEWADKVAHLGSFLLLGWLWMWALNGRFVTRILLFAGGFAVLSEGYQGLLPWERSPDIYDALFNIVGLILGILLYRLVKNYHTLRKNHQRA